MYTKYTKFCAQYPIPVSLMLVAIMSQHVTLTGMWYQTQIKDLKKVKTWYWKKKVEGHLFMPVNFHDNLERNCAK